MKNFKLVFWNDVRYNTEVSDVEVVMCSGGDVVLDYVIESKLEDEDSEDWIEYVNCMVNDEESNWLKEKDYSIFVVGDVNNKVFSIDFCDEFSSCLVIREDSEYFDLDFEGENGVDLMLDVEESVW